MADWERNANATDKLMRFLAGQPASSNRAHLSRWRDAWCDRVRDVSLTMFERLESELANDGLKVRLEAVAKREEARLSAWLESA
jgi:hypothetical protein